MKATHPWQPQTQSAKIHQSQFDLRGKIQLLAFLPLPKHFVQKQILQDYWGEISKNVCM